MTLSEQLGAFALLHADTALGRAAYRRAGADAGSPADANAYANTSTSTSTNTSTPLVLLHGIGSGSASWLLCTNKAKIGKARLNIYNLCSKIYSIKISKTIWLSLK